MFHKKKKKREKKRQRRIEEQARRDALAAANKLSATKLEAQVEKQDAIRSTLTQKESGAVGQREAVRRQQQFGSAEGANKARGSRSALLQAQGRGGVANPRVREIGRAVNGIVPLQRGVPTAPGANAEETRRNRRRGFTGERPVGRTVIRG